MMVGPSWQDILNRLEEQEQLEQEQAKAQSKAYYKMAEEFYQAGKLTEAEAHLRKALELDPENLSAKALLNEVLIMQGKQEPYTLSQRIKELINMEKIKRDQFKVELEHAYNQAVRMYDRGEYGEAQRRFREVMQRGRWFPYIREIEPILKKAEKMLIRSQEAKRAKELEVERERLRLAEEEAKRLERLRKAEEAERLATLFEQAKFEFRRQRYQKAIDFCQKILDIKPTLKEVQQLLDVSQKLLHYKVAEDTRKAYIEHWKTIFDQINLASVLQTELLEEAPREVWAQIEQRKPIGLVEEEEITPEDRVVFDKLDDTYEISFKLTKTFGQFFEEDLPAILGVPVVFEGKATQYRDKEIGFDFEAPATRIDHLLDLILVEAKVVDCRWYVKDGRIHIVDTETYNMKQLRTEIIHIQDILYGIRDFPPPSIRLEGLEAVVAEEPKPVISREDIEKYLEVATGGAKMWKEEEGKFMKLEENGLLIVRNTPEVISKIRQFIDNFRRAANILVNVEVRYISVSESFLEDIGMDFRDLTAPQTHNTLAMYALKDLNLGSSTNVTGVGVEDRFTPIQRDLDLPPGSPPPEEKDVLPGLTALFQNDLIRRVGAVIENTISRDSLITDFYRTYLSPAGGTALQYTILDELSAEMILRLVKKRQRSQIINSAKLTMFNGQLANFVMVQRVGYIKDISFTSGLVGTTPIPEPQIANVTTGIVLGVRPTVSADRSYVTLELTPQLSKVKRFAEYTTTSPTATGAGTAQGKIELPEMDLQQIMTTVLVPDRGIVFIGGLSDLYEVKGESGIPIWRNIPILGVLGSHKVYGLHRRKIIILVKPTIIIPPEEVEKRYE
jgi:Flp pilus assembly secretin CpaC/tetratricopeptide (TPR) repeat protein